MPLEKQNTERKTNGKGGVGGRAEGEKYREKTRDKGGGGRQTGERKREKRQIRWPRREDEEMQSST